MDKKIGFVLSGGGTKSLAHAGALKFFEEQNIKPHIISGTSSGSIIAALYAWGKSPEEILEFFKSIYFFNWKHFTIKKAGIIDSNSFVKYFEGIFGNAFLGDLKIPVYITATDLVKGKLKIFNEKSKIVDAVLASSSFPGVISPYEIDGHIYSDGGILNHFPTDVLLDKCDYIIGVYVSPIQKIEAKDLTTIKLVTTRAFDLLYAHSNMQKFSNCDLIIQPDELSNYSTFETSKTKMDIIFKLGYEEAKKQFEKMSL